jgi:hypothetical protein
MRFALLLVSLTLAAQDMTRFASTIESESSCDQPWLPIEADIS